MNEFSKMSHRFTLPIPHQQIVTSQTRLLCSLLLIFLLHFFFLLHSARFITEALIRSLLLLKKTPVHSTNCQCLINIQHWQEKMFFFLSWENPLKSPYLTLTSYFIFEVKVKVIINYYTVYPGYQMLNFESEKPEMKSHL